jgi:hypothetical protein
MRFDWTVSIGNVITFFMATVAALTAWLDMRNRVKNLEAWKTEHMATSEISHIALQKLGEAVVDLAQIAKGQERRVQLMEDRWPHG